jgi:hypothetical protein
MKLVFVRVQKSNLVRAFFHLIQPGRLKIAKYIYLVPGQQLICWMLVIRLRDVDQTWNRICLSE